MEIKNNIKIREEKRRGKIVYHGEFDMGDVLFIWQADSMEEFYQNFVEEFELFLNSSDIQE